MNLCLTILLITLFAASGHCQKDNKLIEGLNSIIKPITTVNPDDSLDDIAFLQEMAKDAAIIGIGESTHGTAVYDTYRQRLIRFLVQEMGYKAIIDEGDILAAEKLDAYISTIKPIAWSLSEAFALSSHTERSLDWLRSYNKNKPENERVHIYGVVRQPKVDNLVKFVSKFLVLHAVFFRRVHHVVFQSYKSAPIH